MGRPIARQAGQTGFSQWLERQIGERAVDPTGLAARAGISEAYISMLRLGRRRPSYRVIVALASALDAQHELSGLLELAGLPSVARHDRGPRPASNSDRGSGNGPVEKPPHASTVERARSRIDLLESQNRSLRREALFSILRDILLTDKKDWKARRQASVALATMALASGTEYIESALETLQAATQRERKTEVLQALAASIKVLDPMAGNGAAVTSKETVLRLLKAG